MCFWLCLLCTFTESLDLFFSFTGPSPSVFCYSESCFSATIGLPTYLQYCAAGLGERLGTGIVNLSTLVIRSKNNSDLVYQKKIPFTFSVRMGQTTTPLINKCGGHQLCIPVPVHHLYRPYEARPLPPGEIDILPKFEIHSSRDVPFYFK
jgi:hypothetical protein